VELAGLIAHEVLRLLDGERAVVWSWRSALRGFFVDEKGEEVRAVGAAAEDAAELFAAPAVWPSGSGGIRRELVGASFGIASEEADAATVAVPLPAPGGSIRLPSAVDGLVGIRPTIGRVSNHDIVPLAWSMDTAGPTTRTVEDCAIMFATIAGHDPKDQASATVPVSDYTADLRHGVEGLRIGVVPGTSSTISSRRSTRRSPARSTPCAGSAPPWSTSRSTTSKATSERS
jgi:hypothetical protein